MSMVGSTNVVENASDSCAGAVYAPFPELEKLTR